MDKPVQIQNAQSVAGLSMTAESDLINDKQPPSHSVDQ
jgi:hypothetical protein